jgi:hypothetical protein
VSDVKPTVFLTVIFQIFDSTPDGNGNEIPDEVEDYMDEFDNVDLLKFLMLIDYKKYD